MTCFQHHSNTNTLMNDDRRRLVVA